MRAPEKPVVIPGASDPRGDAALQGLLGADGFRHSSYLAGLAVSDALAALGAAATGTGSTIPAMLDAVRAEATLGEICDVLRTVWGTYTEPARF